MNVETFVLGPVMTNAYLVYDREKGKGIVVDPGMEPASLVNRIKELELQIEAVLLTHAHFDHIGGLEEVRKLSGSPVYLHQAEANWLADPDQNGSGLWPGLPAIRCRPAEHVLQGGESLTLLEETFQVLHTPGHSPGSVTYVWGSVIFSGDVLFKDSIGRTDLPGGNYDTLMDSIHRHLMEMPEETRVLCGHGPETTIGREQDRNPFVTGRI
ncbi:MBL fold metallo-hydrolase [Paenactinomyces guangxiensis]|uniref:MBL fold metallo-hydrolase n=1 Tax=Paenactinomyces guangxiensis TaxID=1490290 RepID=A0A7W1WQX4_9BACL|nr:MBL fold metallo-hydrolase [Paenactinomyces guangxiensis]MBA4494279.1 MBL fold metallo-hydrolase [Paenactinomyces guangxiensis]MBH8590773.1 MBL fold metallo-hydrolase [Paenactinomyces guangxiensis]